MSVHSGLQTTSPHEYKMTVAVRIRHADTTVFTTGFVTLRNPVIVYNYPSNRINGNLHYKSVTILKYMYVEMTC